MASIYEKPDPAGTTGKKRWATKFLIEGKTIFASLKLIAPENKKEAQKRANELEYECRNGLISDKTRVWLGGRASDRILAKLSGGSSSNGQILGWVDAGEAYLEFCAPGDTVAPHPQKAFHINATKKTRQLRVRFFCKWAHRTSQPWPPQKTNDMMIAWIRLRELAGKAPSTIEVDTVAAMGFVDWVVAEVGGVAPNRKRVKSALPANPAATVILPDWTLDLNQLRIFGAKRHDPLLPSRRRRCVQAVWEVLLLVRGLGCRPTEALGLTWETVNLKENAVRFVGTKEARRGSYRTAPILFQWVKDGLEELWESRGREEGGAVCRTSKGLSWESHESPVRMMWTVQKQFGMERMTVKTCQKFAIAQLVTIGFPAFAVAKWTGHSLSTQERHYCEEDIYLNRVKDYQEFGLLSSYGQELHAHLSHVRRFGSVL